MTYWLTIALAGLATYATRAVPLAVRTPVRGNAALRTYLDALPTSLIAALVGAAVLAPGDRLTTGAEPLAALVAVGLAAVRRDLLVATLGGVATIAAVRFAGLGA